MQTKPLQKGDVVYCLAGRDCGRYFAVVGVAEDGLLLIADGKHRKIRSPKKKKEMHLQPTGCGIEGYAEREKAFGISDSFLSKALRPYYGKLI